MLRNLVPALGAIALCSTASAQEVAKNLFLDGWVDTTFQADTTDVVGSAQNTNFAADAAIKVGWKISDRAEAKITTKSDKGSMTLAEAYGTIKATEQVSVASGKSYGPIGYYAVEPTGLFTVTKALTAEQLYTVSPVGVWATYAPNDKVAVTAMAADGFCYPTGANSDVGKPKSNDTNDLSGALDVVYNPLAELSLNLEGFYDPSAGAVGSSGRNGAVYQLGFNAQYKKDALTAGGEVLYRVTENAGVNASSAKAENLEQVGWAAFGSYALPTTCCPMAATAQLSQLLSKNGSSAADYSETKGQLVLLTNPIGSSNVGVNGEVFAIYNSQGTDVTTYGVALEALFVIP